MANRRSPRSDFDSPWKEALEYFLAPFLALFFPEIRADIDWMLDLPVELTERFEAELHAWEEENRMPYITSIERSGIEKGLQQGRQEGRQEGLQEGLQEGIAAALAARFGAADKRLMNRVRKIGDVASLRALLQAIPAASSLQEVRAHPALRQG